MLTHLSKAVGPRVYPRPYFSPFTKASETDDSLQQGEIPRYYRYENDRAEIAKGEYEAGLHYDIGVNSIIGGVLGSGIGHILLENSLGPAGAAIGAAAGVAVGAHKAWSENTQERRGTVQVEMNGQRSQREYFLEPDFYQRTPEEIHFKLTAQGDIGERIEPAHNPPNPGPANPETLKRLEPHRTQLTELGNERRLLADFGESSRYGKPVLQMVDVNRAKNMLASDQDVFVLNGEEAVDTHQSYRATSRSARGGNYSVENTSYVQREFDYTLTKLDDPEDLDSVKPAEGLPEGIYGVYRDEKSLSVPIVGRDSKEKRFSEFGTTKESDRFQKWRRDTQL